MSIVLSTGTGNVGSVLAMSLLDQGLKVTIIHREASKVQHLAKRGARIVEGQMDDPNVVEKAFEGATAVFWLVPPAVHLSNYTEWGLNTTQIAIAAAKKHKVQKFVYLSSYGAQAGRELGAIEVHYRSEQALFGQFPNVVALRPGFFMENFLRDVPTVAAANAVHSVWAGAREIPVVAAADIAHRAAAYLTNQWTGHHIVGVQGPQDLGFDQAWKIISEVIGVSVTVNKLTHEQFRQALRGFGTPESAIANISQLYQSFLNGVAFRAEPRTTTTTTATTLHAWADTVFKPAYLAAKKH